MRSRRREARLNAGCTPSIGGVLPHGHPHPILLRTEDHEHEKRQFDPDELDELMVRCQRKTGTLSTWNPHLVVKLHFFMGPRPLPSLFLATCFLSFTPWLNRW